MTTALATTAFLAVLMGATSAAVSATQIALLTSLSRGVTQVIEEQSAGMLAESIERQRRV